MNRALTRNWRNSIGIKCQIIKDHWFLPYAHRDVILSYSATQDFDKKHYSTDHFTVLRRNFTYKLKNLVKIRTKNQGGHGNSGGVGMVVSMVASQMVTLFHKLKKWMKTLVFTSTTTIFSAFILIYSDFIDAMRRPTTI